MCAAAERPIRETQPLIIDYKDSGDAPNLEMSLACLCIYVPGAAHGAQVRGASR